MIIVIIKIKKLISTPLGKNPTTDLIVEHSLYLLCNSTIEKIKRECLFRIFSIISNSKKEIKKNKKREKKIGRLL